MKTNYRWSELTTEGQVKLKNVFPAVGEDSVFTYEVLKKYGALPPRKEDQVDWEPMEPEQVIPFLTMHQDKDEWVACDRCKINYLISDGYLTMINGRSVCADCYKAMEDND